MNTVTSATLLEGLKDAGNRTVWADYVDRYRPMIVGYLQRVGVTEGEAEDIAQDALLAFATAYRAGRYDPERGRLRSWLFGIVHRTMRNHNRRRRNDALLRDDEERTRFFERVEDRDLLAELWEQEWRDAVLRQCLAEVRSEVQATTFEAFTLFVRDGLPAREVGARLGLSENAVFGAKRRVLRRLRELRPQIEGIW